MMSITSKIILILILCIIIYIIYDYNKSENLTIVSFTQSTMTPNTTMTSKPNYFSQYINKKIYLKCKIDNKYYYLVTLSKKLFPELSLDPTEECLNAIVVLMDSDLFNLKKTEYLKKNYKTKEFLGEFVAKEFNNKYIFRSIDSENIDDTMKPTMLNQILYTSYNVNKLCGDMTTYYPSSEFHHFPEIELDDLKNEDDKITFKMCFLTDIVNRTIQNGNKIFSKIFDVNDNALKHKSYIGLSNDTVKNGQDVYKRVNLYYESDKNNIKNILTFEIELL